MANYIKDIRKIVGHLPIRSVSVSCIIENSKGQILLQQRGDNLHYGTPGGNLELNEQIMSGLKREIKEETNIDLINPTLYGIYSGESQKFIYPNGDITYYVVLVFHAKVDSYNIIVDDESIKATFYDQNALPNPINETDKHWLYDYINGKLGIIIK